MRLILSFILSAALVLSLSACSNSEKESAAGNSKTALSESQKKDAENASTNVNDADLAQYKKSPYSVNPREELKLSATYRSAGTGASSDDAWPGALDITLELLKDTGIDPMVGNAMDCIIEEEIGGVWYTVPRPEYSMTLEGYMPTIGHPIEQTVSLSGRIQHPGHYRVLKPVIIGQGPALVHEYYAADFYVNGR